ncbi:unnamed protein product [Adineta ricciae]|uniref:RRM domain-containing protein n=1 Tax=Adineta ricciae TaxID=249248 RepID=A0A814ATR7_ADIRI|nr:unnamed protein product [Adineta ricciae]
MSNRPHIINGDEVFVKRALPRLTASIPERLIVTNRLILQDPYPQDKTLLQNYFRKYGRIKKIDLENGIIDYEDYDDVDRVLLARPHYIRDEEISVTKYSPAEQQEDSDNHHHHQRSHRRHRSKHHNHNEQSERIIRFSKHSGAQQNHLDNTAFGQEMMNHNGKKEQEDEEEEVEDGETNDSSIRYEQLEEQFQEYKQAKEIEICSLRMDLEHTKQQLADLTQEKLDLLIKKQQLFHNELTLRLFPERISMQTQTIDDLYQSPSEHSNKKRKLSLSPSINREFDYYS